MPEKYPLSTPSSSALTIPSARPLSPFLENCIHRALTHKNVVPKADILSLRLLSAFHNKLEIRADIPPLVLFLPVFSPDIWLEAPTVCLHTPEVLPFSFFRGKDHLEMVHDR